MQECDHLFRRKEHGVSGDGVKIAFELTAQLISRDRYLRGLWVTYARRSLTKLGAMLATRRNFFLGISGNVLLLPNFLVHCTM